MRSISMVLSMLIILLSDKLQAAQVCPSTTFVEHKQKIIASGYGINKQESRHNAFVDISYQLSGVEVKSQFIQHSQGDSAPSIEANSSITSHANLSLSVHQQSFACKKGYVTYLLYDQQSLEQRIAEIFDGQIHSIKGPAYLLNSPLFANYKADYGEQMLIQLLGTDTGHILQIGKHRIRLSQDELMQLITPTLPSKHSISLRREKAQNTFTPISTQNVDLYVCQLTGFCQQIARNTQPNTALQLQPRSTVSTEVMFLFATTYSQISNAPLSLLGSSALVQALELSENQPQSNVISRLKIRGNFQPPY